MRRVVITGLGMVSPLGNDVQSSWSALVAGESGAGEITAFDHTNYNVHFACELKDFDPTVWINHKAARRMDRFAQMIIAAARQAEADSGVEVAKEADRFGASIATGIGGLQSYQECYHVLLTRGPDRVSPFSIPSIIPNMGAGWVSIELGTKGPLMSECTACAASNMAIGDAMDEIRIGRADVMFAGGTEAPITQVGIAGFDAMRALSRRNDDPQRASRPFDNERDGLVMGEAAAVLVLEELEHAKARGAKIYAELVGYGMSSDASHMTEPDPTGENPARAMTMAMADAGVDPTEVGYVNAHATSTPLGDSAETRVIKLAFGEEHARRLAVSSTKGATGHCFGAAGAVEAVFTVQALVDKKAPPTINYEQSDPDCDLDYVPNVARDLPDLTVAVSNSFGFGGHNASLVVRTFEP
jgi:3-oxoacyl-[acyl-carrier-protein] synthase II